MVIVAWSAALSALKNTWGETAGGVVAVGSPIRSIALPAVLWSAKSNSPLLILIFAWPAVLLMRKSMTEKSLFVMVADPAEALPRKNRPLLILLIIVAEPAVLFPRNVMPPSTLSSVRLPLWMEMPAPSKVTSWLSVRSV